MRINSPAHQWDFVQMKKLACRALPSDSGSPYLGAFPSIFPPESRNSKRARNQTVPAPRPWTTLRVALLPVVIVEWFFSDLLVEEPKALPRGQFWGRESVWTSRDLGVADPTGHASLPQFPLHCTLFCPFLLPLSRTLLANAWNTHLIAFFFIFN